MLCHLSYAGINLSLRPHIDRPRYNGNGLMDKGDYIDYYFYLKRNHLLELMLYSDYVRLRAKGKEYGVRIPNKPPKPVNGAGIRFGVCKVGTGC